MLLNVRQKRKPLLLSVLITYWITLIPLMIVVLTSYITYQQYIERRNLSAQSLSVQFAASSVTPESSASDR